MRQLNEFRTTVTTDKLVAKNAPKYKSSTHIHIETHAHTEQRKEGDQNAHRSSQHCSHHDE